MDHNEPLPPLADLAQLAKSAEPFPVTADLLLRLAETLRFSKSTQEFLKQFPPDETFGSSDDLITRSEELELLMRDERDMPPETTRSPQD